MKLTNHARARLAWAFLLCAACGGGSSTDRTEAHEGSDQRPAAMASGLSVAVTTASLPYTSAHPW